jgi:hypothetical protein
VRIDAEPKMISRQNLLAICAASARQSDLHKAKLDVGITPLTRKLP